MALSVVILAAGQGKRMVSERPKVIHPVGGRPMLHHVLETAASLNPDRIVVVIGHGAEAVRAACGADPRVHWVIQSEQLGTGHAVAQALPTLADGQSILVLYGDVPLIRPDTLAPLVGMAADGALAVLTVKASDPAGYGRVVRDGDGAVRRIVEHSDASAEERAIDEINTGILAAPAADLRRWVSRLSSDNSQGEYYLTDCLAMAVTDGVRVQAAVAADEGEVAGINDRLQLAVAERRYQRRRIEALMREGVTVLDPARVDIRGQLACGRDVVLDVNTVFEGEVTLGDGVEIGPNCLIRDAVLAAGTRVEAHSIIDGAQVGEDCRIGPFARLRPGSVMARESRVGNFVEIKKAVIGEGSKVNHLSYIGDAELGRDVNIGAGTITCNYDGANKHRTVIGDEVFIGSNSALVAPVVIGHRSTVGAGSTIGKDVPDDTLALTRASRRMMPGWKRPTKKPG